MTVARYFIAAMDCPMEEQLIRNRLGQVSGIEKLDFDLLERVLTVTVSTAEAAVVEAALNEIGMEPKPLVQGESRVGEAPVLPRTKAILLGVAVAASALAEGLSIVLSRGDHHESNLVVIALSLLGLALSLRDTARKGWFAIRTGTLNINFLVLLAVVGAVAIGEWPEAAMASALFAVAEVIEGLSLERARNAVRALMATAPPTAEVLSECGSYHESRVDHITVGSRVRVKPGQSIPLDGVVVEGGSAVNQAAITGESFPVEKAIGDAVFAGTLNTTGTFVFEVTAASGQTTLDRIVAAVKTAQQQRAPTQRFIERFARVYTPAVVGLAVLYALLPPLLGLAPWIEQLRKALVLLVIACPCALVISTPVTIVSGLTTAARLGMLIKGGAFLEQGRHLKVIAFDKTGTLTEGRPAVTDVFPLNKQAPEEVLHLAASLDAPSEHPVAAAIVYHCARSHSCRHFPVESFEALVGRGVAGVVEGRRHFVGNHRLTEENQVCGPHVESLLDQLHAAGKTGVVLTDEDTALAVIGVADRVRPTAAAAVAQLHALGVQTVLLTGDAAPAARAVARETGVSAVHAELLPDDKLRQIERLAQEGMVGMVGDGINDGPALARAQVGFAMGHSATDVALEIADVALLREDLRLIPAFIQLSRQVGRVLAQNITIALGLKAAFFVLALLDRTTLWMAVFADVGGSLLVTLNGLRLLKLRNRIG